MVPRRAQAPVLEVEDPIGEPDRREAIRHHDERGAELAPERAEDLRLDRGVDRRCRVVQDQEPRPADERPRQRHALPLTAGQRVASLAHHRVVPVGQPADERVRLRQARRMLDLFRSGAGVERDVVPHRRGEQEALLEHDRRRVAERRRVRVAEVDAADQHLALVGIVQAHEQLRQRALADAGRTDDRHRLVGVDPKAHLVEDLRSGVRVRDGRQTRIERLVRQPHRMCGGHDGDRLREDLLQARVADHGARQLGEDPPDEPHRPRQQAEQRDELDQVAERHGARRDPPRPHGQQGDRADRRQRLQRRLEPRADVPGLNPLVLQGARLHGEALGLLGLAPERLHDHRAVDALVGDRGDLADPFLRAARRAPPCGGRSCGS